MGIERSQSGIWVNRLTTTPLPQHCQITLLKDTYSIHKSIKIANTHRTWPNDVPNVTEWCRRLMSACLTLFIYIHLIVLYIVMNSPDLFLSVFGTETLIYNNGSIDILDTFQLLFCPENEEISTWCQRIGNLYWCELENGRKTGPRQLSPFPAAGMMRVDNTRNCP